MFKQSTKLPTVYQNLIHASRYAKWLPKEKRRETWTETVDRTINYLFKNLENYQETKMKCREAMLHQKVVPSMRLVMSAGKAHEEENVASYNCCAVACDDKRVIPEILYILMNGTGCGYSVEAKYINKIETLPNEIIEINETIQIQDSKLGWAEGVETFLNRIFKGEILKVDYSLIRPKGTRLKTLGGYASGPEPLQELIEFIKDICLKNKGQKLKPIHLHSIICKVGSIVIVGGVRRSAMISLSDLSDQEMAQAKSGEWWIENNHYALANNSAVYDKKPNVSDFLKEVKTIYDSRSGERGFFNQEAANLKASKIGRLNWDFLTNPCAEILLRGTARIEKEGDEGGGQFCNLSEVIVRNDDTLETIKEKLEIATIFGTIQSTYSNFKFLRNGYKRNTDEERLLGVSLTGVFDNKRILDASPDELNELRVYTREVNKHWSKILKISPSVAINAIKPSGTTSSLHNTASGLHPRYSPFYIRRIRISKTDPICKFLISQKVPNEVDFYNSESIVFSFPMAAPDPNNYTTETLTAVQHFEYWLKFNKYYCDHKVSVTISYKDEEYLPLMNEIYKNFDEMSGISILPRGDGHTYKQAPFEAISSKEYLDLINYFEDNNLNNIDFKNLKYFEKENNRKEVVQLSCTAGSCEINEI